LGGVVLLIKEVDNASGREKASWDFSSVGRSCPVGFRSSLFSASIEPIYHSSLAFTLLLLSRAFASAHFFLLRKPSGSVGCQDCLDIEKVSGNVDFGLALT